MFTIDEIESLSKSLYTILRVEDCFKKTDFHERYGKQLLRIGKQFNNLNRKNEIGNNHLEEYLKWHNQKIPNESPMTKFDFFIEINTLFCSFGLTHYEFLKRFFIETLNLKLFRTKTKSKIKSVPTFGGLVKAFEDLPNFNQEMKDMLDTDFRNALAHDSWYLEDNEMRYMTSKRKLIQIPIAKIPQKINTIVGVYSTITKCYFEEFFPEILNQYADLKNSINDYFPLYGNE